MGRTVFRKWSDGPVLARNGHNPRDSQKKKEKKTKGALSGRCVARGPASRALRETERLFESEYSISDTLFVSEYLNRIFIMSTSKRILSDMIDIIRIRI